MSSPRGGTRALKLISCVCFVLLAVALVLIDSNSPATGYEMSIYESLPVLVWICVIAALAGGTSVVVHQALAGRKSPYWFVGFFVIVVGTLIILLLPVFRGYFAYGVTDPMNHLRGTEVILSNGHFRQQNRYPLTHVLTAQLTQVSGASPALTIQWVPPFFTILFMLFSVLLATSVLPKKGQALLSAASTSLFFGYYHVTAYPQGLTVMILPLVFYCYFKGFGNPSLPHRVALVVLLLAFTFYHPAPAGVLIVCLLATEVAKLMWRARRGTTVWPANKAIDRLTLGPTLISAVTFLTWISYFYVFEATIDKMWGWLTGEIRDIPRIAEVERIFATQALGVQERLVLALKLYGDNLIFLGLSAIALLIIAWRFWRRMDEVKELSILCMPFLVSGPAWVAIFISTLWVTVGRLLGCNIMMWACPVLAAFALYETAAGWKRAAIIVVTSILVCTWAVAILGVYHSPFILQPSWQVTRQDVRGTEWFLAHTQFEKRGVFASLGIPPALALGGVSIPEHFGYSEQQRFGDSWPTDLLVVLQERSRLVAADPVLSKTIVCDPRLVRQGFEEADFHRLEGDPTVTKLYSNGELDVMRTTGGVGA